MQSLEECPLGGGNCDYTDDQVLNFVMNNCTFQDGKENISLDQCLTVFCPNFRNRLIRLVKKDQQKKPVADLGLVRRMEELREDFEDFTLH